MAAPAPTSRKREPIQGDEEAGSELKLGEFQDVDALTHSEAALVINALVAKRKMDRKNVNDTEYVDAMLQLLSYGLNIHIHPLLEQISRCRAFKREDNGIFGFIGG